MKATKRVTKALRALAKALDEEAGKNSELDAKIGAIAEAFLGASKNRNERSSAISPRDEEDLPDVLEEYQRIGAEEFAFALRDLDLPTLKAIVSRNGFDPERRSARWTEPDKLITLILEQTAARLRRGSSFLE